MTRTRVQPSPAAARRRAVLRGCSLVVTGPWLPLAPARAQDSGTGPRLALLLGNRDYPA